MRKLTSLTVALSLFAAGQAFAGEPHAPHAAPPHVVASGHEKLEVTKAVGEDVKGEIVRNATPQQANEFENKAMQAEQKPEQKAQEAKLYAKQVFATDQQLNKNQGSETVPGGPAFFWGENTHLRVRLEVIAAEAKEIEPMIEAKVDDAKTTEAAKIEAKKTEVIDTVKTADAPNSGVANAVATAESQHSTGK
jgi:hypothetical protein